MGHRRLCLTLLVLCLLVPAVAFAVAPSITSFSPPSAVAGSTTVVVVNGTNLKVATTTPVVKIGAVVAPVVSSSATQVSFRVPLAAATGKIGVTTTGGMGLSATNLTVDRRADLRMDLIQAPTFMMAGVSASVRTSVTNVGAVPAGPFKVRIYVFGGPTFDLAHAVLVAVRSVPSLAVNTASNVLTSITFNDHFGGDGNIRFAAIADFENTVVEIVDPSNNLAVAGNTTVVGPNLIGTLNMQGTLGLTADSLHTCLGPAGGSVAGSANFSGHLTIATQTTLSNGFGFTGNVLVTAPPRNGVTPTVTMTTSDGRITANGAISGTVAVTVSGPAPGSTSFTAGGQGTYSGHLSDGPLTLTFTGNTTTGPICLMGGTLSGMPPTAFDFGYMLFSQAGAFLNNTGGAPQVTFPKGVQQYSARFSVDNDSSLPAASLVTFTGPTGSGMTTPTAADPNNSRVDTHSADYQSPLRANTNPPTGSWLVLYKGVNRSFPVTIAPASRFIVPFPTITLNQDGSLSSIDWVLKSKTTGAVLAVPPDYLHRQQVQIDGNNGRAYDSEHLFPMATSQAFPAGALPWSCVKTLFMTYNDSAHNHYVVSFTKAATGNCPILNHGGQPSLDLAFNFTQGTFDVNNTGSLHFPSPIAYYFANFNSGFDANPPASVFFTGPTGSGLSNTESYGRFMHSDGSGAGYGSPSRTQVPAGGTWTVSYKGQPVSFSLPNPSSSSHGIVVVPTVTLSGGNVTQVTWQYKNTLGVVISPPSFIDHVELRVEGLASGQVVQLYNKDHLASLPTSHTLSSPVSWAVVTQIQMVIHDDLGNSYTSFWNKTPPPAPTITNINPTSGHVGNTITITGTNFGCTGCVGGVNAVRFTKTGGTGSTGVAALFTINSPTQITATVPTGAITGSVWIQSIGGTATSATFTVLP